MTGKPYIEGNAKDGFRVGLRPEVGSDYCGPCADVTADGPWLRIITDEYEGSAMLNIETLPMLQKALREIAKGRKSQSQT